MKSPAGRALRKFPTDSELESVGGIYYRKLLGRRPQAVVDVKFENSPKAAVPIEVLGMLVPFSQYKNMKRMPLKGKRYSFEIDNVSEPFTDDSGVNWYKITDKSSSEFYVQSLELARTLFFHSPHLTRTALRPNGLESLAHVSLGDEAICINFGKLSDFPASQLSYKKVRNHLIWLLLSDSARRSFKSIYHAWNEHSDDEPWMFSFTPPRMNGWRMSAIISGQHEKRILEVSSLDVSGFFISQAIAFHHPNLRNLFYCKPEENNNGIREITNNILEMDLPSVPGVGIGEYEVRDRGLEFVLPFTPKIAAVDRPFRPSFTGGGETTEAESQNHIVGAGSASTDGNAQDFNYRLNQSESESHAKNCSNEELLVQEPSSARFPIFKNALRALIQKNHYELLAPVSCHAFPMPKNRSRVILATSDGKPIQFYLASLLVNGITVVILEPDIESLIQRKGKKLKTFSTLLIIPRDDPNTAVLEIAQSVSDNGVKWDNANLCENSLAFKLCSHPPRYKKVGKRGSESLVKFDSSTYATIWSEKLQGDLCLLFELFNKAQR
ncbi:hypothetical protein ABMA58_00295 [Oceanospirillum sp. HFRX-1_2]